MNKSMSRFTLRLLIVTVALISAPYSSAQEAAKPGVYGDEDRDWGVAPTKQFRTNEYHSPTPRQIPGGRVIGTYELSQMLEKQPRPYLIDVLGGNVHRTIAGAFWMIGAGAGDMGPDEEKRFLSAIASFAGGDKIGRASCRERVWIPV